MFKRFVLAAAIVSLVSIGTAQAQCHDCSGASSAALPSAPFSRIGLANEMLDEIGTWLSSNFDLPAIKDRPAIEFVSKTTLATMRAEERVLSPGFTQDAALNERARRPVVALYDDKLKTIFLADGWTGKSPADQSVLVHEMVHHIQNLSKRKFECPMAREKSAYIAQDKWLERFGTSLEKEFEVDMFTVVVASACMS